MSALEFIKNDDTSDVAFGDVEATPDDSAVVKGSKHRYEGGEYVNVENVKGFSKVTAPKTATRRSNRRLLKSLDPSASPEHVDLSGDELVVEEPSGGDVDKGKGIMVAERKKKTGKRVVGSSVQGASKKAGGEGDLYVPDWGVKVDDSFKDPDVCADVLAHFAPPGVRDAIADMEGDAMLSRLILSAVNLPALLAEGVTRFRKGMLEYAEFSKKKEQMKASMAAMKSEAEGFAKKEEAWVKEVGDLKEALEAQKKAFEEERDGLKASLASVTSDNQWLIEHGFQQVVTYLLHSAEFNSPLGDVYTKMLNYGKHLGLVAGYKLHESGQTLEQSPMHRPGASEIFKESVQAMEKLTYPYVGKVSSCFGKPLSVLQGLKPSGLDEKACAEVLEVVSRKRSHSGDSEEALSCGADESNAASLEGSAVGDDAPKLKKKLKKKGKSDGSGASKPSSDV